MAHFRLTLFENSGHTVRLIVLIRLSRPDRIIPDFFAAQTVKELTEWTDYALEASGRLTEPMGYEAASDKYVPVSWDEAFELAGRHFRSLENPNQAAFYTSGRLSNEATFLYQLFAREFGTNNLPDCSNMCHEASGRALSAAIGTGKGTRWAQPPGAYVAPALAYRWDVRRASAHRAHRRQSRFLR